MSGIIAGVVEKRSDPVVNGNLETVTITRTTTEVDSVNQTYRTKVDTLTEVTCNGQVQLKGITLKGGYASSEWSAEKIVYGDATVTDFPVNGQIDYVKDAVTGEVYTYTTKTLDGGTEVRYRTYTTKQYVYDKDGVKYAIWTNEFTERWSPSVDKLSGTWIADSNKLTPAPTTFPYDLPRANETAPGAAHDLTDAEKIKYGLDVNKDYHSYTVKVTTIDAENNRATVRDKIVIEVKENNTPAAGLGGGIFISSTSNVLLTSVSISGCEADLDGGAIYNAGTLEYKSPIIEYNKAGGSGGGIYNAGKLTIGSIPEVDEDGNIIDLGGATMKGGSAKSDWVEYNIASGGSGGGIYSSSGELDISSIKIYNNEARGGSGGGIYINANNNQVSIAKFFGMIVSGNEAAADGGGIYMINGNKGIDLEYSDLRNNSAGRDGGGMYIANSVGAVRIATTITSGSFYTSGEANIIGNSAGRNGGGLYIRGNDGDLTIDFVNISKNWSYGDGGAIYIKDSGKVLLTDVEMSENGAEFGYSYDKDADEWTYTKVATTVNSGGGIYYSNTGNSTLIIERSNLSKSYAKTSGGAVYIEKGNVSVLDSTFANNGSGDVEYEQYTGDNAHLVISQGGSIYMKAGNLDIQSSTFAYSKGTGAHIYIAGTSASTLSVTNTILFNFASDFTYNSAFIKTDAEMLNDPYLYVQGYISESQAKRLADEFSQIFVGDGKNLTLKSFANNIYSHYGKDIVVNAALGGSALTLGNVNDNKLIGYYYDDDLTTQRTKTAAKIKAIQDNMFLDTKLNYHANYRTQALSVVSDLSWAYKAGTDKTGYDQRGNNRAGTIGAFEPIFSVTVTSKGDDSSLEWTFDENAHYFAEAQKNGLTLREAMYWIDSRDGLKNLMAKYTDNDVIVVKGETVKIKDYLLNEYNHRYIAFDEKLFASGQDNTIALKYGQIDISGRWSNDCNPVRDIQVGYVLFKGNNGINDADNLTVIDADHTYRTQDDASRITIDAAGESRAFYFSSRANVVLNNLTLINGVAGKDDLFYVGGAIRNSGAVTLYNVLAKNNTVENTEKFLNEGCGGAIYNYGTMRLYNTTITENTAIMSAWEKKLPSIGGSGGGIYNAGLMYIEASNISKNTVRWGESVFKESGGLNGAGIANEGTLYLVNSTIAENVIDASKQSLSSLNLVKDSSDNEYEVATASGGFGSAIWNFKDGTSYGGGGTLYSYNNTIVNNLSMVAMNEELTSPQTIPYDEQAAIYSGKDTNLYMMNTLVVQNKGYLYKEGKLLFTGARDIFIGGANDTESSAIVGTSYNYGKYNIIGAYNFYDGTESGAASGAKRGYDWSQEVTNITGFREKVSTTTTEIKTEAVWDPDTKKWTFVKQYETQQKWDEAQGKYVDILDTNGNPIPVYITKVEKDADGKIIVVQTNEILYKYVDKVTVTWDSAASGYGLIEGLNIEYSMNYNGALTQNCRILADSKAINSGTRDFTGMDGYTFLKTLTTDQRGADRTVNPDGTLATKTNIGSYENIAVISVGVAKDSLVYRTVAITPTVKDSKGNITKQGYWGALWNASDVTLREALSIADDGTTINFNKGVDKDGKQIYWTKTDGLDASGNLVINLAGELNVNRNVMIEGKIAGTLDGKTAVTGNLALTGNNTFRLMNIKSGTEYTNADVTIRDTIFTKGYSKADVNNDGGAIRSIGNLTLENVVITGNSTLGRGGAIHSTEGMLILRDSIVSSNTAIKGGGGIYVGERDLTTITNDGNIISLLIENSSILDNKNTNGVGGGIYIISGDSVIRNSTIGRNTSLAAGGGMYVDNTVNVTLSNTTFSNNSSGYEGGAIAFMSDGVLAMNFVTVANNQSGWYNGKATVAATQKYGGGIYMNHGTLNLKNSVVAQNFRGAFNLATGDRDDIYISNVKTGSTISNSSIGMVVLMDHDPSYVTKVDVKEVYGANYSGKGVTQFDGVLDTKLTTNGGFTSTIHVFTTGLIGKQNTAKTDLLKLTNQVDNYDDYDQTRLYQFGSREFAGAYEASEKTFIHQGGDVNDLNSWEDANGNKIVMAGTDAQGNPIYMDSKYILSASDAKFVFRNSTSSTVSKNWSLNADWLAYTQSSSIVVENSAGLKIESGVEVRGKVSLRDQATLDLATTLYYNDYKKNVNEARLRIDLADGADTMIKYSAAGNQTLINIDMNGKLLKYQNLTVSSGDGSKAATKTFSGDLYINGTTTVDRNVTLVAAAGTVDGAAYAGNVFINSVSGAGSAVSRINATSDLYIGNTAADTDDVTVGNISLSAGKNRGVYLYAFEKADTGNITLTGDAVIGSTTNSVDVIKRKDTGGFKYTEANLLVSGVGNKFITGKIGNVYMPTIGRNVSVDLVTNGGDLTLDFGANNFVLAKDVLEQYIQETDGSGNASNARLAFVTTGTITSVINVDETGDSSGNGYYGTLGFYGKVTVNNDTFQFKKANLEFGGSVTITDEALNYKAKDGNDYMDRNVLFTGTVTSTKASLVIDAKNVTLGQFGTDRINLSGKNVEINALGIAAIGGITAKDIVVNTGGNISVMASVTASGKLELNNNAVVYDSFDAKGNAIVVKLAASGSLSVKNIEIQAGNSEVQFSASAKETSTILNVTGSGKINFLAGNFRIAGAAAEADPAGGSISASRFVNAATVEVGNLSVSGQEVINTAGYLTVNKDLTLGEGSVFNVNGGTVEIKQALKLEAVVSNTAKYILLDSKGNATYISPIAVNVNTSGKLIVEDISINASYDDALKRNDGIKVVFNNLGTTTVNGNISINTTIPEADADKAMRVEFNNSKNLTVGNKEANPITGGKVILGYNVVFNNNAGTLTVLDGITSTSGWDFYNAGVLATKTISMTGAGGFYNKGIIDNKHSSVGGVFGEDLTNITFVTGNFTNEGTVNAGAVVFEKGAYVVNGVCNGSLLNMKGSFTADSITMNYDTVTPPEGAGGYLFNRGTLKVDALTMNRGLFENRATMTGKTLATSTSSSAVLVLAEGASMHNFSSVTAESILFSGIDAATLSGGYLANFAGTVTADSVEVASGSLNGIKIVDGKNEYNITPGTAIYNKSVLNIATSLIANGVSSGGSPVAGGNIDNYGTIGGVSNKFAVMTLGNDASIYNNKRASITVDSIVKADDTATGSFINYGTVTAKGSAMGSTGGIAVGGRLENGALDPVTSKSLYTGTIIASGTIAADSIDNSTASKMTALNYVTLGDFDNLGAVTVNQIATDVLKNGITVGGDFTNGLVVVGSNGRASLAYSGTVSVLRSQIHVTGSFTNNLGTVSAGAVWVGQNMFNTGTLAVARQSNVSESVLPSDVTVGGDLTNGDYIYNLPGNLSSAKALYKGTLNMAKGELTVIGDMSNNYGSTINAMKITGKSLANTGTVTVNLDGRNLSGANRNGLTLTSGDLTNGEFDPSTNKIVYNSVINSVYSDISVNGNVINNAGTLTSQKFSATGDLVNQGTVYANYAGNNNDVANGSRDVIRIDGSVTNGFIYYVNGEQPETGKGLSGMISARYGGDITIGGGIRNNLGTINVTASSKVLDSTLKVGYGSTVPEPDLVKNYGVITAGVMDVDGDLTNLGTITLSYNNAARGNDLAKVALNITGDFQNGQLAGPGTTKLSGTLNVKTSNMNVDGNFSNYLGVITTLDLTSGADSSNALYNGGTLAVRKLNVEGNLNNSGTLTTSYSKGSSADNTAIHVSGDFVNGVFAGPDKAAGTVTVRNGADIEVGVDLINNNGVIGGGSAYMGKITAGERIINERTGTLYVKSLEFGSAATVADKSIFDNAGKVYVNGKDAEVCGILYQGTDVTHTFGDMKNSGVITVSAGLIQTTGDVLNNSSSTITVKYLRANHVTNYGTINVTASDKNGFAIELTGDLKNSSLITANGVNGIKAVNLSNTGTITAIGARASGTTTNSIELSGNLTNKALINSNVVTLTSAAGSVDNMSGATFKFNSLYADASTIDITNYGKIDRYSGSALAVMNLGADSTFKQTATSAMISNMNTNWGNNTSEIDKTRINISGNSPTSTTKNVLNFKVNNTAVEQKDLPFEAKNTASAEIDSQEVISVDSALMAEPVQVVYASPRDAQSVGDVEKLDAFASLAQRGKVQERNELFMSDVDRMLAELMAV